MATLFYPEVWLHYFIPRYRSTILSRGIALLYFTPRYRSTILPRGIALLYFTPRYRSTIFYPQVWLSCSFLICLYITESSAAVAFHPPVVMVVVTVRDNSLLLQLPATVARFRKDSSAISSQKFSYLAEKILPSI